MIMRAAALAATLSGVPSTLHALVTGRDPLEATKAAGTILRPRATRDAELLVTGALTHATISLAWTSVLTKALPRRHPIAAGAVAGLLIAALDLGWAERSRPRIAALPRWAQLADHVAFGALVGVVVSRGRQQGRDTRCSS